MRILEKRYFITLRLKKSQYLRACAPLQIISTLLRIRKSLGAIRAAHACFYTMHSVQNSSFSFAKSAKLPLLSLRSFPLTCGIVFGVSDAEEREMYYILLVLRYVYLVRKEKNSDDAGRMCECACSCVFVCLPLSFSQQQQHKQS
jgi:hypothetical protein